MGSDFYAFPLESPQISKCHGVGCVHVVSLTRTIPRELRSCTKLPRAIVVRYK